MEDKMFELMTRMYADMKARFDVVNKQFDVINNRFNEIDGRFNEIDGRFNEIDGRFNEIDDRFNEIDDRFNEINEKLDSKADKTDIVRLEDKLDNNSKALFDGYKLVYEKTLEHDKRLDSIEHKIDDLSIRLTNQETRFEVLEGGKKNTR